MTNVPNNFAAPVLKYHGTTLERSNIQEPQIQSSTKSCRRQNGCLLMAKHEIEHALMEPIKSKKII